MEPRDVELVYSKKAFGSKLRSLADALERGDRFRIQVAGQRFYVPADFTLSVEHECDEDGSEELGFQLKWVSAPSDKP